MGSTRRRRRWGSATRRGALLLFLTLCPRQQGVGPGSRKWQQLRTFVQLLRFASAKKGKATEVPPQSLSLPLHSVPSCPLYEVQLTTGSVFNLRLFSSDSFRLSVHWPHYAPQSREKGKNKPKRNCVECVPLSPPQFHIPFLLRATDAFALCFICISAGVVDLHEAKAQFGSHGLFEVTLAKGGSRPASFLPFIFNRQSAVWSIGILACTASTCLWLHTAVASRWKRTLHPLRSLIRSIIKTKIKIWTVREQSLGCNNAIH